MIKLPKFEIEEVEDLYTYYVIINKISEELFWYSEYKTLLTILEDKHAYENWKAYVEEKMLESR